MLSSCSVYTTFSGELISVEHEQHSPSIKSLAAEFDGLLPPGSDCTAELPAPVPLHSSVNISITSMKQAHDADDGDDDAVSP